jgi:hypothetical protein
MSTEQNIREVLFRYVIINNFNFSKFANQAYFIGTNDLIFGPKATEQRRFYTTKLRDFKDKLLRGTDDSSESSFDSPPAKAPVPKTKSKNNSSKFKYSSGHYTCNSVSPVPSRYNKSSDYEAEELAIPDSHMIHVHDGCSKVLKEIGVIHMKQRRGDTRRKSFGGKIVFIACNSLEEVERTKICIAWSKPNVIVVERSSSNILIKAGKTEIHHVLAQNFGQNASMEEGANIAFAKSDGIKKEHLLLYFDDVQEFTNSEWQGGREKTENDACYLNRNGPKVVLAGKLCTFTSYLPPEST